MVININETRLCTIEQIKQFLEASAEIDFSAHGGDLERYAHIGDVLRHFGYHQRNEHERGLLLRYLQHTSGYSRAQLTRLVPTMAQHPTGQSAPCQTLSGTRCALRA